MDTAKTHWLNGYPYNEYHTSSSIDTNKQYDGYIQFCIARQAVLEEMRNKDRKFKTGD